MHTQCKGELRAVGQGEVNGRSFVRKDWYPSDLEAGVNKALK